MKPIVEYVLLLELKETESAFESMVLICQCGIE